MIPALAEWMLPAFQLVQFTGRAAAQNRRPANVPHIGRVIFIGIETMIRLSVLALIILLGVMLVTNPNQDTHKKIVYESIAASKTKSEVLGKIAVDLLGNADVLPMTYNNYYVLSTTTVQGQTASVGMFSHVWKMQ